MSGRLKYSTHACIGLIPAFLLGSQVFSEQTFEIELDAPVHDRWFYPFNGNAGERPLASTFTAFGSEFDFFDDRDGQVLLGFETQTVVPSGMEPGAYRITSGRITLMIESDDIIYDPTPDPWQTFQIDGPADEDPGRANIVSGVAFRDGFDGWSFGESGPYGNVDIGGRNAYPIDFDSDGAAFDISNSLTEGYQPNPFGIGLTPDVPAGEIMPALTKLTFELDVLDPDIQCYLRRGLDDGLLSFLVTSLHASSQQGSGGEPYPDWVMKENSLVFFDIADAAGLELEVVLADPRGDGGDINGDGSTDVTDLLLVISDWGCTCCLSDINDDGRTDVTDLLGVISDWGN